MNFLVKRFEPENFQGENFLELGPTEFLRIQDSEYIVGLGDRPSVFEVTAVQSEVMVQKTVLLRKIRGVAKN